ncbi:recombinase family protein [Isoptericola sp. NPDC057653]|uniref:recombinase family protein n=1 Tax=Isoptericola sp. NPDC057653 TaxID=3346195 RepID=UPI003699C09C
MTRTAIYCRISQDRTGREAGVGRQEEDCRRLAAERGWDVAHVLVDNDVSAHARKTRPNYQRLVDLLKAGEVDAVVAWHSDRLYRRLVDLEALVDLLESSAVQVATVRSGLVDLTTASGRFQARILGAANQYESEIKAERIGRAAQQRAEAGRFSGGARPFGYEADGTTVREAEAQHLRALYDDLLAGVTLREAVRRRAAGGMLSATGRPITTQKARQIVLSPRYAGLSSHRGVVVGRAAWPAIVGEDTWRTVRTILTDPARRTSPGSVPQHLLSGVAVCGVCGAKCRVSSRGAADRRQVRYRCPGGHVARAKDALDNLVTEATMTWAEEFLRFTPEPESRTPSSLPAEAEALRRRRDDLAQDYADGLLSREAFRAAQKAVADRLTAVETALVASTRHDVVAALVHGEDGPRATWETMPLVRKRASMAALWRVELVPVAPGRRGVNDEGVRLHQLWTGAPTEGG